MEQRCVDVPVAWGWIEAGPTMIPESALRAMEKLTETLDPGGNWRKHADNEPSKEAPRRTPRRTAAEINPPPDWVGKSEGGPGVWRFANESMSEVSARYQEQITGRPAGYVYDVNGVKFDGFSPAGSSLLDAKGPSYTKLLHYGFAQDGLLDDAARQTRAAGDATITWHVMEASAARQISDLLADAGFSNITVVHTPLQ